jgi:hypothetical protein
VFLIIFLAACQQKKSEKDEGNISIETEIQTSSISDEISAEELNNGFKSIFDGSTKNGWHIYNNQSNGEAWEAINGELFLNAQEIKITPVLGAGDLTQAIGGGDLASDSEYGNFHLKLEWKISESGNSGIMLFVNESEANDYPWQTGPEIQIIDIEKECDPTHCPGDLYSLASGPENRKLFKGWNLIEVISNNGKLEVIQNGQSLYRIDLWDQKWENTIAQTKFTNWPEFGTFKKGKIVLQDHGHKVWYRNIRIKIL